jgi:translation initiation factor 2 beta subunit (eIF-2beta)/eIF-5
MEGTSEIQSVKRTKIQQLVKCSQCGSQEQKLVGYSQQVGRRLAASTVLSMSRSR